MELDGPKRTDGVGETPTLQHDGLEKWPSRQRLVETSNDVMQGLSIADLAEDHSAYNTKVLRTQGVFVPLLELNSQVFIAVLLLVGGYRVLMVDAGTSVGDMVAFFFMANLFFSPISVLGNQYNQAMTAMAGAERVFSFLDTPPDWADPDDAIELPPIEGRVEWERPEGYELPAEIMEKARRAAALSGGSVQETSSREEALEGAHIVYAKEWGSTQYYGDPEGDARLRNELGDWCVRNDWFTTAAQDCRLMHCLPVRRNTAVADEVLDSPRSIVQREAYNRLVVQMAVLYRMLKTL